MDPGALKPQVPMIPAQYYHNNQGQTKFMKVAQDSKGTHSLQTFIENLETPEFKTIISKIIEQDNPLFYAFNKHATHVLIKYIELTIEKPFLTSIYKVIASNFKELSMDSNGLPLVKKCLAWIRTEELKALMRDQLAQNAVLLAQNAYGNYALQVAFDNWVLEECKPIFNVLLPELQKLSVQKFSSNVIEKIIDFGDQETIQMFTKELNKAESLKILIKNNFGYYVLLRIINHCQCKETISGMRTEIKKGL
mmetsp:Transcript_10221/g.15552  ORF Transcript_10221/g.15552 Transcript_10221/m.15552 type:complete len:251 (-) Transcript_10221:764-1516(-)